MRGLAAYIMRGRLQAVIAVATLAMLSFLFPPLGVLSAAAVGLVALRQDLKTAVFVLAGATVMTSATILIASGAWLSSLVTLPAMWLPALFLAIVLRNSRSLAMMFEIASAVGVLVVVTIYVSVASPAEWWFEVLSQTMKPVIGQAGLPISDAGIDQLLRDSAALMTGVLAATVVLSQLVAMLIARWWQAQLFNPGGFRSEFHRLMLHRQYAFLALPLFAGALLLPGGAGLFFTDLALVFLMVYAFHGLGVVHGVIGIRRMNPAWILVLYLMILIAMPQMVVVLALMGYGDTWLDFRARVASAGTT